MKLYSKPGACSTADHIALHWSGGEFDAQVMDSDDLGSDWYRAINPSGSVLALQDGDIVLTQNAGILGYIADAFRMRASPATAAHASARRLRAGFRS